MMKTRETQSPAFNKQDRRIGFFQMSKHKCAGEAQVLDMEMKVVKLPPDLIDFMKRSSALVRFQKHFRIFEYPVLVQLGSDLTLSSKSSCALQNALTTVVDGLSVETIKLKDKAALPPAFDGVKDILNNAVNNLNRDELRADVYFFQGLKGNTVSKIRLVGFSDSVGRLLEILHDYQRSQVTVVKTLSLQSDEMVDCLDSIMAHFGVKPTTKVAIKALHSPKPHVLVSGPSKEVEEFQRAFISALGGLVTDKLLLDGAGAQRYFQADGKVAKELIESSCNVLILMHPAVRGLKLSSWSPGISSAAGGSGQPSSATQQSAADKLRKEKQTSDNIVQYLLRASKSNKANFRPPSCVPHDLNEVGTTLPKGVKLQQVFGDITNETLSGSSISSSLQMLSISSLREKSTFVIVGLSKDDVDKTTKKLLDLYEAHCSSETFSKKDVENLTQDNVRRLKQLVESEGLHVQYGGLHKGSLKVSGLKDGVTKVVQELVHITSLEKERRAMEEENLYSKVNWCMLGPNGEWKKLPKDVNLELEEGNIAKGFIDQQGLVWRVDLQRKEAETLGRKTKLKRLEHRSDFILPLYWDNMSTEENLKVVLLETTSSEYYTVKRNFLQTANYVVIKIERLQNVHLRRAYEVQKEHIDIKNKDTGGAGEKFLYHGTSQDACEAIKQNGFDRRFSGKNATVYGDGVYFAVNASYSAHLNYARPDTDGSRTMFVARVLTGAFTQGHNSMRVPPPRNSQRPHDRFDSVVDRTDNPNLFVVFNDNQAYPDYLITFQ